MMLDDLKLALRGFVRTPGFTVACVATLAIGIGANTAIFSVVDRVLLRPLAYPDSDRLVMIELRRADGTVSTSFSVPDFKDFQRDNRTFAELAAARTESFVRTGAGAPERVRGLIVSPSLFATLGVAPALGRGFSTEEGTAGKNHVVVLSHEMWQRAYSGDRDVLGRSIVLDDEPNTIVGVMPAGFRLVTVSRPIDLLTPMPRGLDAQLATQRGARILTVVGRLAPGETAAAAKADLDALFAGYAPLSPEDYEGRSIAVGSLHERLTREVRPALVLLLGGVGLVLLIACANVASLLLTRASGRQRELAIRTALGANRARIMRQLLTESLLLAVIGGLAGFALAVWGLEALRGWLPPELARFGELGVDARVLAFTTGAALLTGIIFGAWPALSASRADAGEALRHAAARATARPGQSRARAAIVAGEVALATLLLVGATLMLRSFHKLTAQSPGFAADHLVVGEITLPDARYPQDPDVRRFYGELRERLAALPGVQSSAIATHLPLGGAQIGLSLKVVGAPPRPVEQQSSAQHHAVSPGYFQTLGIPLRAGRFLDPGDDRADAPKVVVVNETLARRYFPAGDAVGKRIVLGGDPNPEREIVGVVGDVRHRGLDQEVRPSTYATFGAEPWGFMSVALRTDAPAGMAAALRAAVAAVDGDVPVAEITTMTRRLDDTLAPRRLNTLLLGMFGVVALLLAVVGVYGVMSYSVAQRVPEIGIRMALGARPSQVRAEVLARGMILAAAGVVLGVGGAIALNHLLAGLLYGVSSTDPLTYALAAAALLVVAALAAWLPARRAARVDPMVAMRSE